MFSSFSGKIEGRNFSWMWGLGAKTRIALAEFLPFPLYLTGSLLVRMICGWMNQILLMQQELYMCIPLWWVLPLKLASPWQGQCLVAIASALSWQVVRIKTVQEASREECWAFHPDCHFMWNYGLNCEMPGTVAMKWCLPITLSSNYCEENWKTRWETVKVIGLPRAI